MNIAPFSSTLSLVVDLGIVGSFRPVFTGRTSREYKKAVAACTYACMRVVCIHTTWFLAQVRKDRFYSPPSSRHFLLNRSSLCLLRATVVGLACVEGTRGLSNHVTACGKNWIHTAYSSLLRFSCFADTLGAHIGSRRYVQVYVSHLFSRVTSENPTSCKERTRVCGLPARWRQRGVVTLASKMPRTPGRLVDSGMISSRYVV